MRDLTELTWELSRGRFLAMRIKPALYLAGGSFFVLVALVVVFASSSTEQPRVAALRETDPVPSAGDAADDPAIWLHPEDPLLSTIIGTDKDRGLAVYDLSGRELQFVSAGRLNNVDLRHGFSLGGKPIVLVTAGNRTDGSIAIYRMNPRTRTVEDVAAHRIATAGPYGSCMYHSLIDGKYYYFVNSQEGVVEQWELYDNGAGKVDARKVRSFNIGHKTEGCVADDELGYLYIGLEHQGIRKYKARPDGGEAYETIARTGAKGHLTADVEGLAIYGDEGGAGYLIASSQGSDEFVIYGRQGNNDYIMSFRISAGGGIDEVTNTDGIDVINANLGPSFPTGMLVVQDGSNDDGNQNFKLVSWEAVENAMNGQSSLDRL